MMAAFVKDHGSHITLASCSVYYYLIELFEKHIPTYYCFLVDLDPQGVPYHLHPHQDLELHYRHYMTLRVLLWVLENQGVQVDWVD